MSRLVGLATVAFAALSVSVLVSSASHAGDINMPAPRYAHPAYAPASDWSGFYAGLNIGMTKFDALSRNEYNYGFGSTIVEDKMSAGNRFTYGVNVGARKQIGSFVVGLETDYNRGGGSATRTLDNCPGCWNYSSYTTDTLKKDWWGSTRITAGYDINGWIMPYVTGGVAYTQLKNASNTVWSSNWGSGNYASALSAMAVGWTAGGGLELKVPSFSKDLSFKVEYLHTDYSVITASDLYTKSRSGLKDDTIRGGFNYRFTGL